MRVLIVEDDKKIANAIKKGLEQETFSVDTAHDGTTGYDLAIVQDYDIIILDLMLPQMNGFEICKKVREKNISTPILILTAKDEIDDKIKGLNIGADDYLTKPFDFKELLARINALLRRPKDFINNELKCYDLTLNINNFLVQRKNQQIILSKKEFALLEYLLRNKNKIVSKEQIIQHVWSFDDDILENTVEQYIKYLRDKIEKPFKNSPKIIQTIRGFGYIVKEE